MQKIVSCFLLKHAPEHEVELAYRRST